MPINDQIADLVSNTSQLLDTVNVSRQSIDNAANTAQTVLADHEDASDPHNQYVRKLINSEPTFGELNKFNDIEFIKIPNGGIFGGVNGVNVSLIGDSRMQDYYISNRRTNGRSWFACANAFMGCPLKVIAEYATSGQRSDQYFNDTNFNNLLNDDSEIVVIGYPFINDISQAISGYTDIDGNVINTDNLIQKVMKRHRDRVYKLLVAGKKVIVCTEPGSTTLNNVGVNLVHQINIAIRSSYTAVSGVFLFDPTDVIWSKSTNDSVISFNTGFSTDGTHATTRQGYVVGRYAVSKLFKVPIGYRKNYGVDQQTAVQIYPNRGYLNTTGGLITNITGSGPLPANTELRAPSSDIVTYSSSIIENNIDSINELTLTLTATSSSLCRLSHTGINTSNILYTDQLIGGIDLEILESVNCRVYSGMQIFTNQATEEGYALFSGDSSDVWTVDGSSSGYLRSQSDPTRVPVGSSSGLAPQLRLWFDFKGVGFVVVRIKDPTIFKI